MPARRAAHLNRMHFGIGNSISTMVELQRSSALSSLFASAPGRRGERQRSFRASLAAGGGRLLGGFMGHGLQTNSHVLRIVSGFCLPRYHASKTRSQTFSSRKRHSRRQRMPKNALSNSTEAIWGARSPPQQAEKNSTEHLGPSIRLA